MVKFSIIIATRTIDAHVEKCINEILKQSYTDFEIILLPDNPEKKKFHKTKIISTGSVLPSKKRDLGFEKSKGEILAFIDSDAYPTKNWLKNCLKYFKEDVGAVGGPNLTPPKVNLAEKVSGDVLSCWLVGNASLRHKVGKEVKEVREMPSCNLFIKRGVFREAGGFGVGLLTAEDTNLCFNIKEKLGKKVIYAPDIVVYHHRRNTFYQFFRQMWIYGRDAGYFMKKDFKIYYTFLTSFVLAVIFGAVLSYFSSVFSVFYFICWGIYLAVVGATSLTLSIRRFPLIFLSIIITHFTYGIAFGYGWVFFKAKVNLNIR